MTSNEELSFKPLSCVDIEAGLQALGVRRGDAVEVHSSLSSFGKVEGGAPTVIEALMRVVGHEGALVMSAYPVTPPLPVTDEEQARGITWKVRLLPEGSDEKTGMGIIVDTFKNRPDVICGSGVHRVCAWGRDAELHSRGYRHLVEMDGWVLLLGVNIHRCSSMHLAEEVPLPAAIERIWQVPAAIRRDYPEHEWGIGYGDTPNDAWMTVYAEAERRGLVRHQQIGQADCLLFRASAMVAIYEDLRRTDPFGLFGVAPEA